jgi:hypothetical protein
MLTRKLLRRPASRQITRALTTSLPRQRTPSLADIEPDKQDGFNERQKEFRARAAEAQKQREASGFSSSPSSSTTSSSSPSSATAQDGESSTASSLLKGVAQGLGSLSTASLSSTGHKADAENKEPSRRAGPLTNLIYGTKEGREMDAQIEASFSQVLARGKYVHSIVFHEVKPDRVDEYVDLVGQWYPKMANMPENKVHLVGSWRTEVGDCDTFGDFPSSSVGQTVQLLNSDLTIGSS